MAVRSQVRLDLDRFAVSLGDESEPCPIGRSSHDMVAHIHNVCVVREWRGLEVAGNLEVRTQRLLYAPAGEVGKDPPASSHWCFDGRSPCAIRQLGMHMLEAGQVTTDDDQVHEPLVDLVVHDLRLTIGSEDLERQVLSAIASGVSGCIEDHNPVDRILEGKARKGMRYWRVPDLRRPVIHLRPPLSPAPTPVTLARGGGSKPCASLIHAWLASSEQSLAAIHIGLPTRPWLVFGYGNGLILGYLMYRSGSPQRSRHAG